MLGRLPNPKDCGRLARAPGRGGCGIPFGKQRKGLDLAALGSGGQSLASLCRVLVPSPSSGVSRGYFWEASGAIREGLSEGAFSFPSLLQPKL